MSYILEPAYLAQFEKEIINATVYRRSYMKKLIFSILLFLFLGNNFSFSEDYSLFMKDELYGLITNDRKIVIQPEYNNISINPNSIICSKKREIEIYNTALELLFSDSWVNLSFYTENEIVITESMSAKKQLLNVVTGEITTFYGNDNYFIEEGYRDGIGLVWEKNKEEFLYSIVDRDGNVLLTDIEQAHNVYTNGMLAVIMKDGKSGFVNTKGQFVIETSFYIDPDDIGPRKEPIIWYAFSENYVLVKTNELKWVQFNKNGKMKTLPDNIEPVDPYYENGLVLIRDKTTKKMGYMNPNFEIIIPCKFDGAHKFIGKYAAVVFENKDAIIDKKGKVYFCENLK